MSENKSSNHMILIAFDIETTGPILLRNAIIELGVCALNSNSGATLGKESWDIKMEKHEEWDVDTLRDFWNDKSWEKMEEGESKRAAKEIYDKKQRKVTRVTNGEGIHRAEVMKQFVLWVEKIKNEHAGGDEGKIRFVSDTVSFDSSWLNLYLCMAGYYPLHLFFEGKELKRSFVDVISVDDVIKGWSKFSHEKELKFIKKNGWFSSFRFAREELNLPDDIQVSSNPNHDAADDAENIGQNYILFSSWIILLQNFAFQTSKTNFIKEKTASGLIRSTV